MKETRTVYCGENNHQKFFETYDMWLADLTSSISYNICVYKYKFTNIIYKYYWPPSYPKNSERVFLQLFNVKVNLYLECMNGSCKRKVIAHWREKNTYCELCKWKMLVAKLNEYLRVEFQIRHKNNSERVYFNCPDRYFEQSNWHKKQR